jgi:sialate O-acetylesterase
MLQALAAKAAVTPNGLIADHMVLQQGVAVPIWGSARDGEKVTVAFAGQAVSTAAKNGRWMVRLAPLKANATPQTMTIKGDNTLMISDVLIGEVWICGGQSNMEWFLANTADSARHIAGANDPLLRLTTIPRGGKAQPAAAKARTWAELLKLPWHGQAEPQRDVDASWTASTSSSVPNFSAVGYFFGRDLRKARGVPVGIISSSVGGTGAELWTSRDALATEPFFKQRIKFFDGRAKPKSEVKPSPGRSASDPASVPSGGPSSLYNAMIAPLQPFAISGFIWYQGENDRTRAEQYKTLFPTLIKSWRDGWSNPELPFLFVQLAPFDRTPPEIREVQLLTWQKVPRTAMVVITDHGEANSIHPAQKEPVGARLALAARAIAYGEKIEYSGPVVNAIKVEGNKAILSFIHVGTGLVAKSGELKGFTISGDGKNFVPASAKIFGATVVVSSPEVVKPKEVRFGWANVPDVNLFNQEGLPATPFRIQTK